MKKRMCIKTHSYTSTMALGKRIASVLAPGTVLALSGNLGTGKTTLTKGIVAGLFPHTDIVVKSPSFALVNQYTGTFPVYHIDCYRLDSVNDFTDIGIDEYLFSDGVTIVEWAEKIKPLMPKHTVWIRIAAEAERTRSISITASGAIRERMRSVLCVKD